MKTIIRKLMYVSIIIFFLLILKHTKVQAATTSISASTREPTEGQSVTVTASVTAGAWDLQFSGAGKTEKIFGYTQSNANASDSKTITFTAGAPGTTYKFTLTGDMTDISATNSQEVNDSIEITVKASNTGTTTPPSTSTKSSEARLSNLGFNPEDFTGFRRDKTEYNVEVSNSVSSVKIYATPVDSKATVTGTGTVNLKEGLNTVKVTVTAENGSTKTYTMNITRLTAEEDNPDDESEARLKNLGIRPTEYDFSGFRRDTTSYTVEVPNELAEVEVYAEAVNSNAKITGTGKVTLQEGENTVNIEVTAPDGTTKKTYTLIITRTASTATEEPEEPTDDEEKVFGLSQLLVKGQNISPKFSEDVYEYTIGLTEDLSSLEIEALASDDNATVEIVGNENLQNGENIITILVSNAETGENATYQIIVNKNVQDETAVGKVDWLKPSTWGTREKIIVGVAIALIMIIIVAIVIKVRLARRDDDDMDLPGGEELDRALSEHQEIEDEVSEAENDVSEIEENVKSDAEIAQEYFESYSKRRGKHF